MEHTHSKQTNLTLAPVSNAERAAFRDLYRAAFPPEERKPLWLLDRLKRKGVSDLLSIRDGARMIGLAVVAKSGDLALLDFFAIAPTERGKGYGARALRALAKRYADKRLFLEIERIDEGAANNAERLRRKAFYLRNGLTESGFAVRMFGVALEVMQFGAPLTYAEYRAFLARAFGRGHLRFGRVREIQGE